MAINTERIDFDRWCDGCGEFIERDTLQWVDDTTGAMTHRQNNCTAEANRRYFAGEPFASSPSLHRRKRAGMQVD